MAKIETIDFHDFMMGSVPRVHFEPLSVEGFLDMPDFILDGYLFMGAVGFITIGFALAEKYFVSRQQIHVASKVATFMRNTLPWSLIAICIWFVLKNPLM